MRHTFAAKLWLYPGAAAWHFVTLPRDISRRIRDFAPRTGSPFGSLRVRATVGRTAWHTSLFPDRKAGAYLLPIKAEIRRRERVAAGDTLRVALELAL